MKKTKNLTFDGERWGYDFTKKGKRIRAGGFMTKAQAEVTLTRLKIRKMDEALGLTKPTTEDVSFEKFADIFLETHSKQSKRSWKSDERSLANLKRAFKGETLASIGPEKVERYRAARKVEASKNSKLGAPISASTANRELACLKTLFSKAVEWGRIEVNPAARVKKLKEPPGRETILTEDQARRLVAAAGSEFRPVVIVALGTAMRRGEILALKWTDLDLVRGIITVANSKSGRSRKIPMSGTVAAALGGIPHHGEFVFWNPETKTQIKDVKTAWAAACARAKKNPDDEKDPGIVGVRFHDCRHTALTWMLQSGADHQAFPRSQRSPPRHRYR